MSIGRYDPLDPGIQFYGEDLMVLSIEWESKVVHVDNDCFMKFFPNNVPEMRINHCPDDKYPFMVMVPCKQCTVTAVLTNEEMENWYGRERLEELMGGEKVANTASC